MKPLLSLICPGIRTQNWRGMYDSVVASTSRPFEIIFVSPYHLPESLQGLPNVKLIRDYGSPVRCSNIGLAACQGEIMSWNSDDGSFLPQMIDKAIDAFETMPPDPKNVLITKYMEGEKILQPDSYFKLCNAYPRTPFISEDWYIFNLVFTKTEYFRYLGGWDSAYETLALSHADMAVRAYRDNCKIKVFHEPIVYNTHGIYPDHQPIEIAHHSHDEPLYKSIYSDPNQLGRIRIDLDNWKNAPEVWHRRFGNIKSDL